MYKALKGAYASVRPQSQASIPVTRAESVESPQAHLIQTY